MQYDISNRMKGMKPSIIREILKQMSDPALISFAGGNPAAESFPVADIAEFSAQLLQNDATSVLQYSLTEGVPSVRAEINAFANRKYTLTKNGDELIITSGSQQILELVCKCLCNEGDIVAVEEPAFLGAYNAFRSYGAVLCGVPLEADGVNLAALEAAFAQKPKPKFFYCIPNFQNPTGVTTSMEKRRAIYALAVKYNVPILEDDPYGELRFEGSELPPIKSMDEENAVIYAGSFSKILCPAMRLAYCVCAKELSQRLVVAKQVSDVHTNVWAQRVCAEILQNTDIDAHIQHLRKVYQDKAELMMTQLNIHCPEISYNKPYGGMFIWAKLSNGIDVRDFIQKCLERKLAIVPGNAFFTDDSLPSNTMRLNFSTSTKEDIIKGVGIMRQVLDTM
ncbi:MAG: PLP-dependent aminotransferase family protein [Oscillospiraceae bacterium]